jgi:hypothetical protein
VDALTASELRRSRRVNEVLRRLTPYPSVMSQSLGLSKRGGSFDHIRIANLCVQETFLPAATGFKASVQRQMERHETFSPCLESHQKVTLSQADSYSTAFTPLGVN